MVVLVVLGIAAACLVFAMFTGTGWLMRQRRRNDQTVAGSYQFDDEPAPRGGKDRFPG
jgi:hypothetical protein